MSGGIVTFTKMLSAKYNGPELNARNMRAGVTILVKNKPALNELEVAALTNSRFNSAGPPGEILETCPNLRELDIAESAVDDFNEILKVVSQLPKLCYLSISGLRIKAETFERSHVFPAVTTLMASHSAWSIDQLLVLAFTFPSVGHLTLGRCRLPDLSPLFPTHWSELTEINLSQSNISSWDQLEPLERLPKLNKLTMCRNPINIIPEFPAFYSGFSSLQMLNLKLCMINDMVSVHNLNALSAIIKIKLAEIPLHCKFQEHFRMMIVAYMPKIKFLNGGLIKDRERVTLERQFVREFCEAGNESAHRTRSVPSLLDLLSHNEEALNQQIFTRLFAQHGIVRKFAEVNLAPPIDALISFQREGHEPVQHRIPVKWTVKRLKLQVSKLFQLAPDSFNLVYGDHEIMQYSGLEPLKYENYKLHSVGFKDNDIVIIEPKSRR